MSASLPMRELIATRSGISRFAIVAGYLLIVLNANAAEESSHDYFCAKYEAVLQFEGQRVLKSYGGEFPSAHFTSYTRTGSSSSHLVDCSTKTMFCLEERIKSQTPDTDVFVYALPKRTKVGDTYQIRGVSFRVDRYPEFPGLPPSVVIFAEGGEANHRMLYKMYVEQGTGIKQLHFATLRAAPPGSAALQREYTGVTCTLVSKQGLFSGVKLQVPPPADVVD